MSLSPVKIFFIVLAVIILSLIILGFFYTRKTQNSGNQEIFLKGIVPSPLPEGIYKGSIGKHKVSWLGKAFNSQALSGINMFVDSSGKLTEKYPFKIYIGRGLLDKNLTVLKIDYNIASNPLWVRIILDEIVQISENVYLGKVILKIIPGFPFSVGYFELTKDK